MNRRPLKGRYFDGKSGTSQSTEVEIRGEHLYLHGEDLSKTILCRNLRVEDFGPSEVLLTDQVQRIILDKKEFQKSPMGKKKTQLFRNSRKLIVGASTGLLAVITIFYFYNDAISGFLSNFIPESFVISMAKGMEDDFKSKNCLNDKPLMAKKVEKILNALSPQRPVTIVFTHDPDIINAFALPGGTVVFTNRILNFFETPEEFLAVLAHEVAHIELDHHRKGFVENMLLLMFQGLIFGKSENGIGHFLLQGVFNQQQEVAADKSSATRLSQLGVSTKKASGFFARLNNQSHPLAKWMNFTHPGNQSRIDFFNQFEPKRITPHNKNLQINHLPENRDGQRRIEGSVLLDSESFKAIQQACRTSV